MLRALLVTALLATGCSASTDSEPAPAAPERWTVELSTAPTLLTVVDEAVLAASYGNGVGGSQVYRVDRGTGRLVVLRTVPTAHPATRLVLAGGALVVVGPQGLQRVDPDTGTTSEPVALPAAGSAVATGDADHLWVVHPDEGARAVLQPYDPVSLAAGPAGPSPGRAGAVAQLAGGVLWVSDPSGGRLLCADPASGRARSERAVALTGPVAADARTVVVAQVGGMTGLPADCTAPGSPAPAS